MRRFSVDDVVPSMKWGFLADGLLMLLRRKGGQEIKPEDQLFIDGAEAFLKLVLEGIGNSGRSTFSEGGISKIVESLTIYGYASKALPGAAQKEEAVERIRHLLELCEKWRRGELGDDERSELDGFFSAIAHITLEETQTNLSSRESNRLWPSSRSLQTRS